MLQHPPATRGFRHRELGGGMHDAEVIVITCAGRQAHRELPALGFTLEADESIEGDAFDGHQNGGRADDR
jgi:hypothetical protein